jgi:hypothetical protein
LQRGGWPDRIARSIITIFDDIIVIIGCTPRGCIVIIIWW